MYKGREGNLRHSQRHTLRHKARHRPRHTYQNNNNIKIFFASAGVMCTRTRTHARKCPAAPQPRHGFAAPRQHAATCKPVPNRGTPSREDPPGRCLAWRWQKVSAKCKKVEKSLEGEGKFTIFAGEIKSSHGWAQCTASISKYKSYETARSNN